LLGKREPAWEGRRRRGSGREEVPNKGFHFKYKALQAPHFIVCKR